MSEPLVSVAINNFNYGRFVGEAIESALAQRYPRVEVIVVDDGSTDDSRGVIDAYGDRVTAIFQENRGMAATHNVAFAQARGDVVVFLDADDVLLPTAADRIVGAMSGGVAQVHWPLRVVDAEGRVLREEPEEPLPDGDLREVLLERGPFSHRTTAMSGNAWSRSFLEGALPMPETDFRRHSDAYLVTLAPLDGPIRALREPQTEYRVHGGNDWACEGVVAHARRLLATYPALARALSERLRRDGLDPDPELWKQRNDYYGWLVRTDAAVDEAEAVVPRGAAYVVLDDDEWGAASDGNLLPGRTLVPFFVRDGVYWGPPPDDAAAVAALDQAHRAGADFVLVPWFSLWWLDHYRGFREALRALFPRERREEHLAWFAS